MSKSIILSQVANNGPATVSRRISALLTGSTDFFQPDYKDKAHVQDFFNEKAVVDFAGRIAAHYPGRKTLKILDLCCGHGKPTALLQAELLQLGIQADMTGYDISKAQIEAAAASYPDINFKVQDLETMTDYNEYDVVVSFFGLHWVGDKKLMAQKISQALKPGAQLIFLVPLAKPDLFKCRHTVWERHKKSHTELRSEQTLQMLPISPKVYQDPLRSHFLTERTASSTYTLRFNEKQFMDFIASWDPAARVMKTLISLQALKPEVLTSYLRSLLSAIQPNCDVSDEVNLSRSQSTILFQERLFTYDGTKRNHLSRL